MPLRYLPDAASMRATASALLALFSVSCGGLAIVEPCPAGYEQADGACALRVLDCPPGHEQKGARCVVREVPFDGATFLMGHGYCPEVIPGLEGCPCELPDAPHQRTVGPFSIDAVEVTVNALEPDADCPTASLDCLDAATSLVPAFQELEAAEAYCFSQGKALPNEAEWELVASAGGTRTYPWGDDPPSCALANFEACATGISTPASHFTTAAGTYPPSAEGVYDLAGNAPELVEVDEVAPGYPAPSLSCPQAYCDPGPCPVPPLDRGGASGQPPERLRAAHRSIAFGELAGFRCVRRR